MEDDDFLLLFNAHHEEIPFVLPIVQGQSVFEVLVDTALPSGQPSAGYQHSAKKPYSVQARSLVLLRHPMAAIAAHSLNVNSSDP